LLSATGSGRSRRDDGRRHRGDSAQEACLSLSARHARWRRSSRTLGLGLWLAKPLQASCSARLNRAMHTYSSPPVPPARRRGWSVSRPQYAVVAMAQGRWHRPWLAVSRLSNHHSIQTVALATSPALRQHLCAQRDQPLLERAASSQCPSSAATRSARVCPLPWILDLAHAHGPPESSATSRRPATNVDA
jgi:hypothetical protein